MEEKLRFVFEYERDERTMKEVCENFGITRETGYLWLRRQGRRFFHPARVRIAR